MIRSRPIALAVTLASLVALVVCSTIAVRRAAAFSRDDDRPRWTFREVLTPGFSFAGREVSFTEIEPTQASPFGAVRLAYGDETLELPVQINVPGFEAIPDLRRFENWLRVLRFVDARGMTVQQALDLVNRGELDDRLVVAVRIPPPGADAGTWAEVWRSGWKFDLHELKPDGSIDSDRLSFPTSNRRGGPQPGDLIQGTWQFDAALLTMPRRNGPSAPVFRDDAFHAMGWAFWASGFATFGVMLGFAFLIAPARVTEESLRAEAEAEAKA